MKYSDEQRLQKILENAEKLIEYLSEHKVTKENLMNDYALQWLVTTPLYNIGEHVYNLSDEYKSYIIDVLRYCSKGVSGPYDFMNKEFFDALFLPKEECFERLSFLMDDPRLKVLTEQAKDNQTVMDSSDNDPFNDGENNLSRANEEKGSISEPKKKETNQAVRVPDVLSSVKISKSDAAEKGENNAKNEKITENSSKRLTEAARTVYDTFSDTSMSIDSIILASGLAVNVVMAAVTELQAAGLISSVPGGKFIKT